MMPAWMNGSAIMPLVQVDSAAQAPLIAQALAAGGIHVIEIALRSSAALEAIEQVRKHCPDVSVGAGTVIDAGLARGAQSAGARFLVSPGTTPALLDAMQQTDLPCLPGVSTVSEALAVIAAGVNTLKFFPAAAAGGPIMLNALRSVLPTARFCPTGGINERNLAEYLGQANVFAAGGSWLTPSATIARGDYAAISRAARAAVRIAEQKTG